MAPATPMDKDKKLALVQRQLGLKHKLKVFDSVPAPESHEDLAKHWVARWDLEDELAAIERILAEARTQSVEAFRQSILKNGVKKKAKK